MTDDRATATPDPAEDVVPDAEPDVVADRRRPTTTADEDAVAPRRPPGAPWSRCGSCGAPSASGPRSPSSCSSASCRCRRSRSRPRRSRSSRSPPTEVRVCAGALLRLGDATGQDAGTGVALGAPSVRSGVRGRHRPSSDVLESTDAGTGGTSAAPAVFQLDAPSRARRSSAAQSQVVDERGLRRATPPPRAPSRADRSGWSAARPRSDARRCSRSRNPTEVDATVSLTIYGENGRGDRSRHERHQRARPATQRVLSLAGFAPELALTRRARRVARRPGRRLAAAVDHPRPRPGRHRARSASRPRPTSTR